MFGNLKPLSHVFDDDDYYHYHARAKTKERIIHSADLSLHGGIYKGNL